MGVGLVFGLAGAFALAREKTVHINGVPVTDAKGPAVGLVALGTLMIVYGARARRRAGRDETERASVDQGVGG